MPIYEFICPACKARVENQVMPAAMVDMVKLGCPNGHGAMRRVLTIPTPPPPK